jgi:hypothetical protein
LKIGIVLLLLKDSSGADGDVGEARIDFSFTYAEWFDCLGPECLLQEMSSKQSFAMQVSSLVSIESMFS